MDYVTDYFFCHVSGMSNGLQFVSNLTSSVYMCIYDRIEKITFKVVLIKFLEYFFLIKITWHIYDIL